MSMWGKRKEQEYFRLEIASARRLLTPDTFKYNGEVTPCAVKKNKCNSYIVQGWQDDFLSMLA